MTYIDPSGKLLQHLDRLAALKAGYTPVPINLEIDLSNRCSLGCEWCHFAYTHTRGPLAGKRDKPVGAVAGGDLMDTELAFSILEQLSGKDISVTWTGGGEPTLHPGFDMIATRAAELGIQQGIYTHGGHVNAERAALMKKHFRFVYVSLDAVNSAMYFAEKRVDRFDKVCDNIRLLAAAAGEATIGIGYLVTDQNWQHADEAAKLTFDLGASYVQFRPTVRYEQDAPDAPAEDTGWINSAIPYLHVVAQRHDNVEVDFARFIGYRDWRGHGYQTCWWSGLQAVVTPNGKVWTCVNKREHPGAELGDLTLEPFGEIWARRPIAHVDGGCRLMCRGHVANLTLTPLMQHHQHAAFV